MNKQLTLFAFTISLSLFSFSLLAQTINAPDFLSGDSFTIAVVDNVEPLEPGENMSWDYSGLLFQASYNGQYLPAATSAAGDDFPGAEWMMEVAGQQFYYKYGPESFEYFGGVQEGVSYSYSNTEVYHPYPFAFGETHEDLMGATLIIDGAETLRSGTILTVLDGYGTLDLPGGIHMQDMCRFRCNRVVTDSTDMGVTIYTVEQVWFVQNGLVAPVVVHTNFLVETPSGTDTYIYTEYLQAYTVGADEIEQLDFAMFPNPANDYVNLKWQYAPELVEIRDASGRLVQESSPIHGLPAHRLDTSDLAPGIYSVTSISGESTTTKQLVVE